LGHDWLAYQQGGYPDTFYHTGRVNTTRPGPITQPDRERLVAVVQSQYRCRKVGGINKQEVIRAFQRSRENRLDLTRPNSEPESSDSDNPNRPYIKRRRRDYSKEDKLQALSYLSNTDIPGKNRTPDKPNSLC
jgi:hypothetical protein